MRADGWRWMGLLGGVSPFFAATCLLQPNTDPLHTLPRTSVSDLPVPFGLLVVEKTCVGERESGILTTWSVHLNSRFFRRHLWW